MCRRTQLIRTRIIQNSIIRTHTLSSTGACLISRTGRDRPGKSRYLISGMGRVKISGVARAFVMPGPASMVQEFQHSKIRKLSQEHKADARAQARVGPGLATPLVMPNLQDGTG